MYRSLLTRWVEENKGKEEEVATLYNSKDVKHTAQLLCRDRIL
jgi:hypothetical protein